EGGRGQLPVRALASWPVGAGGGPGAAHRRLPGGRRRERHRRLPGRRPHVSDGPVVHHHHHKLARQHLDFGVAGWRAVLPHNRAPNAPLRASRVVEGLRIEKVVARSRLCLVSAAPELAALKPAALEPAASKSAADASKPADSKPAAPKSAASKSAASRPAASESAAGAIPHTVLEARRMRVAELRAALSAAGLPASGLRPELAARLVDAIRAGAAGVRSAPRVAR
ncbi:unnamed protein product, partial [Prorocentrum cordatum]